MTAWTFPPARTLWARVELTDDGPQVLYDERITPSGLREMGKALCLAARAVAARDDPNEVIAFERRRRTEEYREHLREREGRE